MKPIVVTTSWDDGHKLDLKLAQLLKKYNIPATFYVSPFNRELDEANRLSQADIKQLSMDFEIGSHSMTHPHLDLLDVSSLRKELEESKKYLESIVQKPVTSFCYPYGNYNDQVKELVRDSGYKIARTTKRFETRSIDRYAISTSADTYDHMKDGMREILSFCSKTPWSVLKLRKWDNIAKKLFEVARERGEVFHLWGHSLDLEKNNGWERFEAFLAWLSKQPDVTFVTNGEIPVQTPKLLMTTPYFKPHSGGLEERAFQTAKGLEDRGLCRNVTVITSGSKNDSYLSYFDGIKVYRLPHSLRLSNTPFGFKWRRKIKHILSEERPDIIDAHAPVPGMLDVTSTIAKDTPLFITYHFGSMLKGTGWIDYLIGFYEKFLLPMAFQKAKGIICTSGFVKQSSILSGFKDKCIVISPGVHTSSFKPPATKSPGYQILHVGGLKQGESHKELKTTIKTLAVLAEEFPDVNLKVVGNGERQPYFEDLAAKLGVRNKIQFCGRLAGQDLVKAYQDADVLMVPSRMESFGMVIIEAMACGVPIVASNAEGIPFVLKDNEAGLLVDHRTPKEFAKKIATIFRDPALAKRFSETGRFTASNSYQWDEKVSETYNFYLKTLNILEPKVLNSDIHETNKPTISLVMTLLNEGDKNLDQLLNSIQGQTVLPNELIICDGGSTDSTTAIIRKWAETNSLPFQVRIIVEKGANISRGRNFAIKASSSKVIAVTDGSCRLDSHWLEEITKPIKNQSNEIGIVFGDTKAIGNSKIGKLFAALHYLRTHSSNNESTDFSSRSVAFTKDAWEKVGGYPEWLTLAGEDTLFFIDVRKVTDDNRANKALVFWEHGAESLRKIFKMHKRNSVGSGEALMYPAGYAKMIGIYIVLLAGICTSPVFPFIGILATASTLALWSRMSLQAFKRTHIYSGFLMMPAIVAARDIGMVVGFIVGLQRRYIRTPGNATPYELFIALVTVYLTIAALGITQSNQLLLNMNVIIGIIPIFILPGFLLIRLLGASQLKASETLVYSAGLSLFALIATGLAVNTILPLIGIYDPLSWRYIIPMIGVINFSLLLLCAISGIDLTIHLDSPRFTKLEKFMTVIPILFVVLSIAGAISLNDRGTDLVTLYVLTAIGLYIAMLLFLRERVRSSVYPLAIFMICLSLLLMVSLRGWIVSGHDILAEYRVFEMTKTHLRWNIGFLNDAYNACLSITLLPTIIKSLLPAIPDQYILRIVFQVIFALTPVAMFHFASKFLNRYLAFLAVLFFMVQSPFLRDFPFLTRQEIATFFFVLMLLAFSKLNTPKKSSIIIALLFGWSMIVSHYSTTYVTLTLLIFALIFKFGYRRFGRKFIKIFTSRQKSIKEVGRTRLNYSILRNISSEDEPSTTSRKTEWMPGWNIILLLAFITFSWNIWITHTSNNLNSFTKAAIATSLDKSQFSGIEEQLNGPADEQTNSNLIKAYATNASLGKADTDPGSHYPSSTYNSYNPDISIPFELSPQKNPRFSQKIFSFGSLLQDLLKLLLLVGIVMVAFMVKRMKPLDRSFSMLTLSGLFVLFIALVVPAFTQFYDVFRTYQQLLIVLAIPTVIATTIILCTISKRYGYYISIILFTLYYFFVSPVVPQVVGSGYAQLQLNNYGLYYNLYYTHESEYYSIQWLQAHDDRTVPVYADWFATKKIEAFTTQPLWVMDNVLPANITTNSFVYEDYTNTQLGAAYTDYESVELNYRFPTIFVKDNKDAIYSNSTTEILK